MSNKPAISLRPDPELVQAAKDKGLNLRALLEDAIKSRINTCPHCGAKLKKPPTKKP